MQNIFMIMGFVWFIGWLFNIGTVLSEKERFEWGIWQIFKFVVIALFIWPVSLGAAWLNVHK